MLRFSKNSTDSSQTRRHRRAAQCALEVLESRQLLAPLASTPNLGGVARSVLPTVTSQVHGSATVVFGWFIADRSITAKADALGPKFTGPAISAMEYVPGSDINAVQQAGLPLMYLQYQKRFANCDIYYSSTTDAHEVHGDIRLKWNDLRAHGVNLGIPTSDEMDDGFGGRISYFQGGIIDWTPQTGAHEVHGAILAKWNDLRAHGINLGHPTSDEMNAPSDLRLGPGGRISHFERGDIAWFPSGPAFQVGVRSVFV